MEERLHGADGDARQLDLVEGVGIHEDAVLAVDVEELHGAALDGAVIELFVGMEAALPFASGEDILEESFDGAAGLAASGLELGAEDPEKLPFQVKGHSRAQVRCNDHDQPPDEPPDFTPIAERAPCGFYPILGPSSGFAI